MGVGGEPTVDLQFLHRGGTGGCRNPPGSAAKARRVAVAPGFGAAGPLGPPDPCGAEIPAQALFS